MAYEKIKQLIALATVLRYYTEDEESEVQCDASQEGLGCAPLQQGQTIVHASQALMDMDMRYAQIKELLAVVYSVKKFHHYAYGRHMIVKSNHKTLEAILTKPLHKTTHHLQNMCMQLQKYDFQVKYQKGKLMIVADTLSCAFVPWLV